MAATFTPAEQTEILTDAAAIDIHLVALRAHLDETGAVTPLRTLGHWEEMRLDQRDIVRAELAPARAVATHWPSLDELYA